MNVCTLVEIRDVMARLPNLDNLSLLGSPVRVDEDIFLEVGTTLGGRFGGKLVLRPTLSAKDFMNMSLEIPTGFHEHVIGDPNRITLYRGGNLLCAQVSSLGCQAHRSMW